VSVCLSVPAAAGGFAAQARRWLAADIDRQPVLPPRHMRAA